VASSAGGGEGQLDGGARMAPRSESWLGEDLFGSRMNKISPLARCRRSLHSIEQDWMWLPPLQAAPRGDSRPLFGNLRPLHIQTGTCAPERVSNGASLPRYRSSTTSTPGEVFVLHSAT
jgi:hypothetical protein